MGRDPLAPLGKAGLSPVGSRQPPRPAAPPGHDKQTQLFKLVRVWGREPSQLKKGANQTTLRVSNISAKEEKWGKTK